jgi:hypothetical protein
VILKETKKIDKIAQKVVQKKLNFDKKNLNSIEKTDKSPNVQIVQTGCSKRVQSS